MLVNRAKIMDKIIDDVQIYDKRQGKWIFIQLRFAGLIEEINAEILIDGVLYVTIKNPRYGIVKNDDGTEKKDEFVLSDGFRVFNFALEEAMLEYNEKIKGALVWPDFEQ